MTEPTPYTPPAVWSRKQPSGGRFANINRPDRGATHDKPICRSAGIRCSSIRWPRRTASRSR